MTIPLKRLKLIIFGWRIQKFKTVSFKIDLYNYDTSEKLLVYKKKVMGALIAPIIINTLSIIINIC